MSDWKAMAADAADKEKAAQAAEADVTRLIDELQDAQGRALETRTQADAALQDALLAEWEANPEEPVFSIVNGKRVAHTPEEREAIKAEWAANRERQEAEAKAAAEEAAKPTIEEQLAAMKGQLDALAARAAKKEIGP